MVLCADPTYWLSLRPKITFKDVDGSDIFYTFDPFQNPGTNTLNVFYLDCQDPIGETGDFNILIDDSNNQITSDHLRNGKVFIEFGKTEATKSHFLIGFCDIFDVTRPRSFQKEYRMSGFGSVIQAAELLMRISQASKIQDITNPKLVADPEFNVNRLFERSIDDRKFRPVDREPLGTLTGWGKNISNKLNTNVPIINEVFSTFWDYWDTLSAISGGPWWVDYSGGLEVLTSKPPTDLHSGVVIMSSDLGSSQDDPTKTSYIKDYFSVTDDSSTTAGVATRVYATTILDQETISSSFTNKGSETLNSRFIAQQLTIQNDQRRITDLAFIVRKIGEPDSPNSRINGFIVMDENNTPTGTQLAKFEIPLSSTEADAQTIFVNDINIKTRFLEGTNKIWLGFKDRSGIKGNVENDPVNTVAWHHDGNFTAHSAGSYSAKVIVDDEDDRDKYQDLNWQVSTNGPKFAYSVMSSIRRLQARTNSAYKQLRMKERFIPADFLKNSTTINRFLSLNLARMSKPKRVIRDMRVSIPNNFLFRKFQYVSFIDGLSGISQDLQVQNARYVFSGLPGDEQYGTRHCELTLLGEFNSLTGSCSCL